MDVQLHILPLAEACEFVTKTEQRIEFTNTHKQFLLQLTLVPNQCILMSEDPLAKISIYKISIPVDQQWKNIGGVIKAVQPEGIVAMGAKKAVIQTS